MGGWRQRDGDTRGGDMGRELEREVDKGRDQANGEMRDRERKWEMERKTE